MGIIVFDADNKRTKLLETFAKDVNRIKYLKSTFFKWINNKFALKLTLTNATKYKLSDQKYVQKKIFFFR